MRGIRPGSFKIERDQAWVLELEREREISGRGESRSRGLSSPMQLMGRVGSSQVHVWVGFGELGLMGLGPGSLGQV